MEAIHTTGTVQCMVQSDTRTLQRTQYSGTSGKQMWIAGLKQLFFFF